ncbi:hypothetical protein QWI29_24605 [Mycolicibacterium neoaurum]|uniref:hypothetical protein n=1 Tax=Mycolicibacterium neoaurum TaxID=1795 RepID=UPI00267172A6|nr:hypothetical protein [Mycolicibacterium neoaurum]MDO3403236.1 hypothetical protein [Mycolicibacterium neoaurum]
MKRKVPPWGLATIARESLLYGNENRRATVSDEAVTRLLVRLFNSKVMPDLVPGDKGFALALLTPILYEQFPWQESIFEELARSHALLIEGLQEIDTEILSEASIADVLGGISLREAIGATFVVQVGAYQNGGSYNPGWLDQENFREVLAIYSRSNIETTASRLTATRSELKADFNANTHGNKCLAKYDYNPLVRTPFVAFDDGSIVAPAPRLIMRTVTPGGLYYPGIATYGPGFATELGWLFEHYVGRNLRLIAGAEVHPEIRYGSGKSMKSIDWFVVMPGLVLLVECKLKRLSLSARAGDLALPKELFLAIERAYDQLRRSVENVAAGTAEFAHIPSDRPLLAMVISAEPSYIGNAYLVEQHGATIAAGAATDVPVAALSARELETLVTHGEHVEELLLRLMQDRAPNTALGILGIHTSDGKRNPILESAWATYLFPSAISSDAESAEV